jgi:hypothetical protein
MAPGTLNVFSWIRVVMAAAASESERLADVERRFVLVEMFLDSELRERHGIASDAIRKSWRANAARKAEAK